MMDVKVLAVVFASVFLAELGDKTQLATLLFASDQAVNRLTVFVAASAALIVATGIGVLAGGSFRRREPAALKNVAGRDSSPSARGPCSRRRMKTQIQKVEAFRALHARPEAFIIPNPWDVGTARMLAKLGFEALATTSAGYAFSAGGSTTGSAATGCSLTSPRSPRRRTCRSAPTSRTGSATARSRRGDDPARGCDRHRRRLDRGLHRSPGREGLRHRPRRRRIRAAVEAKGLQTTFSSRRARRITSSASRISKTRSGACRRTRRPARTCSTRPASRRGRKSRPS